MKNNIIIFVSSLLFLLVTTQCDVLDQPVLGVNGDTPEYYDSVESAEMAVGACYYALYYPAKEGAYRWVYGDVRSDDAIKGGGSEGEGIAIQYLKDWSTNIDGGIGQATTPYVQHFKTIYFANTILDRLKTVTFDEKLKKRFIAEVKFIRAYAYFNLVIHHGDVPLFVEPVDPNNHRNVTRTPFEKVLEQVEIDLKEAAVDLPQKYTESRDEGRITSGAAKSLHARVVMYSIGIFKSREASAWQDVYDLTSEVINSNQYRLYPNYPIIFESEGELCSESVFEIQYKTTKTGWGWGNQGNPSCVFVASRGTPSHKNWGWGYNCPTQNLVDEFEPEDPRLYATVHGRGITDYLYGVRVYIEEDQTYLTGYATRKLALPPAEQPTEHSDGPYNERIIRYADVLLMKAEAAFYLGKADETRDLINQVRTRARTSTYPKGYLKDTNVYTPTPFQNNLPDIQSNVNGDALLKALKHERRVELAMEGLRYFDLVRWGDYRNTLSPDAQARYDKFLLRGVPVLPIPASEVTSWGLPQNPLP